MLRTILVLLLANATAAPALAQAAAIPRTADGRPDLQGAWMARFMTQLERPDGVIGLVVPAEKKVETLKKLTPDVGMVYDPEFDYAGAIDELLVVNGEMRSSQIVEPGDGKLPLTALARTLIERHEDRFDGPELRPGSERCVSSLGFAPLPATSGIIPLAIVQTAQHVVIMIEDVDAGRVIHLTAAAPPDAMRSRAGYSRGRWEGDTLVVETDHIEAPEGLDFHGDAPVTADSRVIERFSLRAPGELLYQFTVEDPSLYKRPWRAEYVMRPAERPPWEYACHEGNHALANILSAARLGKQEPKPKSK